MAWMFSPVTLDRLHQQLDGTFRALLELGAQTIDPAELDRITEIARLITQAQCRLADLGHAARAARPPAD